MADEDQHIGLSYGPGAFTDAEFEEAAKEVVNPDLQDYEFFVESHGTKIYRHYKEVCATCMGSCMHMHVTWRSTCSLSTWIL